MMGDTRFRRRPGCQLARSSGFYRESFLHHRPVVGGGVKGKPGKGLAVFVGLPDSAGKVEWLAEMATNSRKPGLLCPRPVP